MEQTLRERLKEALLPLYKEANITISPNAAPYCTNWASKYPEERGRGLLFVGKATNGWDNGGVKDLDSFFDSDKFLGYTDRMRNDHTGKSKTKDGEEFNPDRSAYRRMLKRIGERFYGKEWYDYIAFTNLYKFAPSEGGNPSPDLQMQQLCACQKILAREIEILDPKVVIFFTNPWEKPFLPYLNDGKDWGKPLQTLETKDKRVRTQLYKIGERFYIITSHPQGKKEWDLFKTIETLLKTHLPNYPEI